MCVNVAYLVVCVVFGAACVQRVTSAVQTERAMRFSVLHDKQLVHPSCRDVCTTAPGPSGPPGPPGPPRRTCSHLSCALWCVTAGPQECQAFAYVRQVDGSDVCRVCAQFMPGSLLTANGIVGVLHSVQMTCPPPPPIYGAELTSSVNTSPGSVASYRCVPDHTYLSGTTDSVCDVKGQWSDVTIDCVMTDCYYWWPGGLYPNGMWWYDGNVSVTVSGIPCQVWGDNNPHVPDPAIAQEVDDVDYDYPEESDLSTNYCRNYGGYEIPWCYTMDPSVVQENCAIPKCPPPSPPPG